MVQFLLRLHFRLNHLVKYWQLIMMKMLLELTKKNIEKFDLSNISVIYGNAKEKITELEEADAIFVGGTGGDTKRNS